MTYLCPFSGPIKGNLYLTNYKLFFASKDRQNTFEVPLGVVRESDLMNFGRCKYYGTCLSGKSSGESWWCV